MGKRLKEELCPVQFLQGASYCPVGQSEFMPRMDRKQTVRPLQVKPLERGRAISIRTGIAFDGLIRPSNTIQTVSV